MLISQPSTARPLQSRKVPAQLSTWQLPAPSQLELALARVQTLLQPPQLAVSVLVLTSQPSPGSVLQS